MTSGPDNDLGSPHAYVLGHSEREIERLSAQASLLEPITRQFLCEAGIVPGMRVLDFGSGAGDVAFLAADLVGDTGEVVGVDRASAALAAARKRSQARSLRNVSFHCSDPAERAFKRPFDAVVGRYVLLFQHDPSAMLRTLASLVRPGGLVAFHEPDWSSARSFPPAPTYERCCHWVTETFHLAGNDTNMACKLHAAFVGAGLPAPSMRMQTFIGAGPGCTVFLQAVADLVGSVLPTMERLGVATAAEVEVATLAERLRLEVTAAESVIIGRSEIGAWSRV
jgi:2-polyprenyl-3-methyl-5-hydroxy-6-metoxy-1,4-benzoquinol methylase